MPIVAVRGQNTALLPQDFITSALAIAQAGPGTVFLTQLTPGYTLGPKKRQEVGSQAEPPFRQLPIEIPIETGDTVNVSIVERTAGVDPKVGRRNYVLNVRAGALMGGLPAGTLLHQEEIFFDQELTSRAGTGGGTTVFGSVSSPIFTPVAQQPGVLFQQGSQRQQDLTVLGFFAATV